MTGDEKSAFTVVLGCQLGGQKLPLVVIFKRKALLKDDVTIEVNPKSWMDNKIVSAWLREVYVWRAGGFFHKSKSLLIYDSMHAHLTDSVKVQEKTTTLELAIIPGELAKKLQPLDFSINCSL